MTTPATTGRKTPSATNRRRAVKSASRRGQLDRALNLNAAFYLYDYKGLQVGVNVPAANGVPLIKTINAGSARTYGIDFDLSYRPPSIENLALHFAGEWNNAKFTDFVGAQCWGGQTAADGCNPLLPESAIWPVQRPGPDRGTASQGRQVHLQRRR